VTFTNQNPTPVCTVTNTTTNNASVALYQYGFCYVVASQPGNTDYSAATPVLQPFGVAHESQTITFGPISTQIAATTLPLSASATSGLTVSFASQSPNVCTVSGTTASLISYGTCFIQASQSGNIVYNPATSVIQMFGVGHASQTITFGPIAGQIAATTLPLSATASSGLTVSFSSLTPGTCTVSGTSASLIAYGTCTIQASQAGNGEYFGAPSVNQSFGIGHASQTITFGTIASQVAATTLPLSATASSGLAVSFVSETPSICTVSNSSGWSASLIASGTCTIQAQQLGNGEYFGAPPVNQSFSVAHATQTISFSQISQQTVGVPLTLTASASSGLAITYSVPSQDAAVCSVSGSTATFLTPGRCVITANQNGNSEYLGATPVSVGFTVVAGH
jgi:hypothetical protein